MYCFLFSIRFIRIRFDKNVHSIHVLDFSEMNSSCTCENKYDSISTWPLDLCVNFFSQSFSKTDFCSHF